MTYRTAGAWLGLCLASATAQGANICWVERVLNAGNGAIRVVMRAGYEGAARQARRPDKTWVQRNNDGTFDLREGDAIFLSTLPHDSCTGTVKKYGEKLGLELKASMCMSNMGCQSANAVVVSE